MNERFRQFGLSLFAGWGLMACGVAMAFGAIEYRTIRTVLISTPLAWLLGSLVRQMIHDARDKGYEAGKEAGHEAGYREGYEEALSERGERRHFPLGL